MRLYTSDSFASYETVNPCISYNYIVKSLKLAMFKSGSKAVCAALYNPFLFYLVNSFMKAGIPTLSKVR